MEEEVAGPSDFQSEQINGKQSVWFLLVDGKASVPFNNWSVGRSLSRDIRLGPAMKGWFDAFRSDGGPTLYSFSNRTPVTEDAHTTLIYLIFITVFVAFLIIFPGVRKERFTTFASVTLSMYVGAVILLCNYGSSWHVSQARVAAPYRAFSKDKVIANIGVYIGLNSVNITLKALPESNLSGDIDYNERFCWSDATDFKKGYREALEKGLPFPILTVAEYLSLEDEGFCWGGRYRIAGYYSSILLWTCFASWLLMNILFAVVPRYGAFTMVMTGLLQLLTSIIYSAHLPSPPMVVPFEGGTLRFRLGWCFWLTLITGFLCVIVGVVIAVIDILYPHKFSTVLEVDYDTPYDRHIILKDNKPQSPSKSSIEDDPSKTSSLVNNGKDNTSSKRRKDASEHVAVNKAFEDDDAQKGALWRTNSTEPFNQRQQEPDVNIQVQAAAMW